MGAAIAPTALAWRARDAFRDAIMLGRLTSDLPAFLNQPIGRERATQVVTARLRNREHEFLGLARKAIYGWSRSPYLQLLKHAGCVYGDLQALVASRGLEGALQGLAAAGVYLSYEEFKGRCEVVRGSHRFAFEQHDFDNPFVKPHFEVRTGGTTGRSMSIMRPLSFVTDQAFNLSLVQAAHGLSQAEHVIWLTAGVTHLLRLAKLGVTPAAWFYPVEPLPPTLRLGSAYLSALSRLVGRPIPTPSHFDLREPERMARWLVERVSHGRPVCVSTYGSSAARVSAAAADLGLDLTGVWFDVGGEPFTQAKQRTLEAVGARSMQIYALMEAGIVGYSCATPREADDMHLFTDSHVLIQHPRPLGVLRSTAGPVDDGDSLDVFLLTPLLRSAAKIMLNVENGDFGLVETRPCDCPLGEVGLTTHLAYVRSFEKLTGEGVAFVQTDLVPLVEEQLPARFGGSSADYQVLEREDSQGIIRLFLLVSSHVGAIDEDAVRQAFLDGLSPEGGIEQLSADLWQRAGTVQVLREQPQATSAGKILPFYFARATAPQAVAVAP